MLLRTAKTLGILALAAGLFAAGWLARDIRLQIRWEWPPVFRAPSSFPPSTPLATAEPLQPVGEGEVRLLLVGDVLPLEDRDYLAGLHPLVQSADYAICNLECPLSTHGTRTPLKHDERGRVIRREFIFTVAPAHARRLADAGFDAVTLANNHIMDYGGEALLETLGALDAAGLAHSGAGADTTAARQPIIAEVGGQTIALLSYVSTRTLPGTTGFAATTATAGTVFVQGEDGDQPTPGTCQMLSNDIAAARKRADFVIATLHWGTEARPGPDPLQRNLAHWCLDAGADMVVGHHPHVLQGIEIYRGRPIVYSLGNFVFPTKWKENHFSAALELVLCDGAWRELRLHPVKLQEQRGDPGPATGEDLRHIVQRITTLSQALGTTCEYVQDDGPPCIVITNPQPAPKRSGLLVAEAERFFTEPAPGLRGMSTVHLLAWDQGGERRRALPREVVVCNELADEVLGIFREIYLDEGRFPIHDLVGYDYRSITGGSGLSNHAYGRAIDINRAENPMIENGRKIVHPDEPPYVPGEWRPGEDPYSVTPDGVVVRAFKSRGWRWGGDWTSCKDYQHFDKPRGR